MYVELVSEEFEHHQFEFLGSHASHVPESLSSHTCGHPDNTPTPLCGSVCQAEAEPNTAFVLFCTSSTFRKEETTACMTGHTGGETSHALRRLESFITRCLYFQVTGAVSATPQKPQRQSLGWPEYPALALCTVAADV